jgi:hypothetical protein
MKYHSIQPTPANNLQVSFKECTTTQVGEISNYISAHCSNISFIAWGVELGYKNRAEFTLLLKNALLYHSTTESIKEFETLRQRFFPELEPLKPTPAVEFTFEYRGRGNNKFHSGGVVSNPQNDLRELQRQLARCIEQEAYEKAAEIRDRIESCKKGKE